MSSAPPMRTQRGGVGWAAESARLPPCWWCQEGGNRGLWLGQRPQAGHLAVVYWAPPGCSPLGPIPLLGSPRNPLNRPEEAQVLTIHGMPGWVLGGKSDLPPRRRTSGNDGLVRRRSPRQACFQASYLRLGQWTQEGQTPRVRGGEYPLTYGM